MAWCRYWVSPPLDPQEWVACAGQRFELHPDVPPCPRYERCCEATAARRIAKRAWRLRSRRRGPAQIKHPMSGIELIRG